MRHSKKQIVIDEMKRLNMTSPLTRSQILTAAQAAGLKVVPPWAVEPSRRAARGLFNFPELTNNTVSSIPPTAVRMALTTQMTNINSATVVNHLIPTSNSTYVPWGHYDEISDIIKSGKFAPVFITGLSGNGKTTMVEQICAKQHRALFRVNITELTDEDDLLGGMRLVDGNTVWQDGPVVKAMEMGSILLLDEVDLGSHKIMCLQPVLEGKGVFLKKINRWVYPKAGFNVLATANTKGKGSDDGRFVGTNILNEAFLDRFDFTYEQDYAPRATEKRILMKKMEFFGKKDEEFADCLTRWSETIRKAYHEGAVTEIVTTRRLEAIAKLYSIIGDRLICIERCLSRFDSETKSAFLNFYTKIDVNSSDENNAEQKAVDPVSTIPLADPKKPMKVYGTVSVGTNNSNTGFSVHGGTP